MMVLDPVERNTMLKQPWDSQGQRCRDTPATRDGTSSIDSEAYDRWTASRTLQSKKLAATRTRLLWQARRSLEQLKRDNKASSDSCFKEEGEIFDEVITTQFTDDPTFNIDFQLSGSYTPSAEPVQVQHNIQSTNCGDIQFPQPQYSSYKSPAPITPPCVNTFAFPSNTSFYHSYPPISNTVPTPQYEVPVFFYSVEAPLNTEYTANHSEYSASHSEYTSNHNVDQYQPITHSHSADSLTSNSFHMLQPQAPSKSKSRSYPTSPQEPLSLSASCSSIYSNSPSQSPSHSPSNSPSQSPSHSPSYSSLSSSSHRSAPYQATTSTSTSTKPHSRAQSQSPPRRVYKPKEKQQRRNDHSGDFRKVFFQYLESDLVALAEWTTFMVAHGCPKPRVCVRTHLAFCDMRTQKYGENDSFAALRLNPKWRRLGSRTFCECMSFGPCYIGNK